MASKLTYVYFTVVMLKICQNVQFCTMLICKFFNSNDKSDLIDQFYAFSSNIKTLAVQNDLLIIVLCSNQAPQTFKKSLVVKFCN